MMGAGAGAGPAGALPALHALELGAVVDLHDAVDFAVGVLVVLTAILVLGFHVDGRDGDEVGLGRRRGDAAPSIPRAVQLVLRHPPLLQALSHVPAEILVESVARSVFCVEPCFERRARRPVETMLAGLESWKWDVDVDVDVGVDNYRSLTSRKNS